MFSMRWLIVPWGIGLFVTCTSAFSGGNGMISQALEATKKHHNLASSFPSRARCGGNTLTMSARHEHEHPGCPSDAPRMPRRSVMARLSAMALLLSGTKRVVAEAGPVYLLFMSRLF
jgi:hypothetical protein